MRALPEHFNAAGFFVDRHLGEGRGGRTAFRFAGRAITYAEVAQRRDQAAAALAGRGIEIENRVLLVLDDTPAFAAAFWGAVTLGAVAVPVNTLMTDGEYEFLLQDSRAKVVVAEEPIASRLRALRGRSAWLRDVLTPGDLERAPATWTETAPTLAGDVMYWGYTSGSTGKPKAAVHSHRDLVAAAELVGADVLGLGPDDLTFSASKLYFAFGLGNTLYFPAFAGAASVLVPERMTPELAFDVIAAARPTIFFAVPTLYARMLQLPDAEHRWDLSSLRFCVCSGEPLPPVIFDAWADRFGLELVEVVGSTEALHDFIANRPGKARRGSAGQLVPGFEAKLLDDAGAPAAPGAVGHLLIKGPTTSPFYWNRRERTRATMLGEWLRTGDMFTRDEEGWFTFAGRSDDMVKVGGLWVSPAEVEACLAEHPAVLEAGVVGRPGADGLARIHAVVVPKDPGRASASLGEELQRFVRDRTAGYKVPRAIEFAAELPKTATGKIQRFRLRGEG